MNEGNLKWFDHFFPQTGFYDTSKVNFSFENVNILFPLKQMFIVFYFIYINKKSLIKAIFLICRLQK